jgi:hypothetical protein
MLSIFSISTDYYNAYLNSVLVVNLPSSSINASNYYSKTNYVCTVVLLFLPYLSLVVMF